jgi:hypothetical protein
MIVFRLAALPAARALLLPVEIIVVFQKPLVRTDRRRIP